MKNNVYEFEKIDKAFKRIALGCGAVLMAVLFRVTAVTKIPANTVGVKVSAFGGVQDKTLPTGYHLKLPFVDKIYKLPTSVQNRTKEAITTQTKDGQWLNTNIDIKYKVNKQEAMTVFSNYTNLDNVSENVIAPAVQRAIESVTGEYDIYEVLGDKRTDWLSTILSLYPLRLQTRMQVMRLSKLSVTNPLNKSR